MGTIGVLLELLLLERGVLLILLPTPTPTPRSIKYNNMSTARRASECFHRKPDGRNHQRGRKRTFHFFTRSCVPFANAWAGRVLESNRIFVRICVLCRQENILVTSIACFGSFKMMRERRCGSVPSAGGHFSIHELQYEKYDNVKKTKWHVWLLRTAHQRRVWKMSLLWGSLACMMFWMLGVFRLCRRSRLLSFPFTGIPLFLPKSSWPFSLKYHLEEFETIVHPGDNKTQIAVPKFWSPPVHRHTLIPRPLAMKIGTCARPDEHGNQIRGDACPLDQRTIFVGIASYRDFQCRETVEFLLKRASNPERIRVGVVDQIVHGMDVECDAPIEPCQNDPEQALCKYRDQIDLLELDAPLSIGPTFARHLGHRMYRGEYYALQTDAHITFVQDWDKDIIAQIEATKNEMAVLTTYLSDIEESIDAEGRSMREKRPILCNTVFDEASDDGTPGRLRHDTQPETDPKIKGSPQLEPWWGAGFSFSRGHFVVNVPYDFYQQMVFQGEEMSVSIRAFTVGYDFYAPERSVCFHHYGRKSPKIKYFDENEKQYSRQMNINAMKRLLGIVHLNKNDVDPLSWDHRDEQLYGLGGVRTPEKFYETFGINVLKQQNERHLCKWVDAEYDSMHTQFTPHLREDGMGISYDEIHFRFKDPFPDIKDDDLTESDEDGGDEETSGSEENDEDKSNDEEGANSSDNANGSREGEADNQSNDGSANEEEQ